ncbi:hypothetical protein K1X76_06765 [bacterium]|nr:hypothetical protein [bacterium]
MSDKPHIAIVLSDPGAVQAVLPVYQHLNNLDRFNFTFFLSGWAREHTSQIDSPIVSLGLRLKPIEVIEKLENLKPALLLTGTSSHYEFEQVFRNTASNLNIPSLVVIDQWSNLDRRFTNASRELFEMTDYICVMDEATHKSFTREGFNPKRIIITGQPYFEKLASLKKQTSASNGVLFLSQPVEYLFVNTGIPFPERHPFLDILESLKKVFPTDSIYFKQHPLEKCDDDFLNELKEIKVLEAERAVYSVWGLANTVVGYNSTSLLDALAVGKKVVSIELVPYGKSLERAFDLFGITRIPISNKELLEKTLENTPPPHEHPFQSHIGATLRIADLAIKMIEN